MARGTLIISVLLLPDLNLRHAPSGPRVDVPEPLYDGAKLLIFVMYSGTLPIQNFSSGILNIKRCAMSSVRGFLIENIDSCRSSDVLT